MHTKIPHHYWTRFRCLKLTQEERAVAMWALTIASPSGFIPDDPQQAWFDTGVQDETCLSSAMSKLRFEAVEGGWWMHDYIQTQVSFNPAKHKMASTVIKDMMKRDDKMVDMILSLHESLIPLYEEFKATGKIVNKKKQQPEGSKKKPKGTKLEELPDKEW